MVLNVFGCLDDSHPGESAAVVAELLSQKTQANIENHRNPMFNIKNKPNRSDTQHSDTQTLLEEVNIYLIVFFYFFFIVCVSLCVLWFCEFPIFFFQK